jgi:hypothetical protein
MSAFKGTPGPWEAKRTDPQEWAINAPNGDPALKHGTWYGLAVAYGCDESPSVGREVAEANARLIAAAPDLLDQHEADMVDLDLLAKAIHAGDPMPELVIRVTDMLNRKRAAIAKATGEQT